MLTLKRSSCLPAEPPTGLLQSSICIFLLAEEVFLQKTAPTLPVIITKSLSRNQCKERPQSKVNISLQFSQFFWTKEPSVISISQLLLKNGLKQLFDQPWQLNSSERFFSKYCFSVGYCYCMLLLFTASSEGFPANIYLLKVNNRNIRKRHEMYSKLAIKTPERRKNTRMTSSTSFWCFYC